MESTTDTNARKTAAWALKLLSSSAAGPVSLLSRLRIHSKPPPSSARTKAAPPRWTYCRVTTPFVPFRGVRCAADDAATADAESRTKSSRAVSARSTAADTLLLLRAPFNIGTCAMNGWMLTLTVYSGTWTSVNRSCVALRLTAWRKSPTTCPEQSNQCNANL